MNLLLRRLWLFTGVGLLIIAVGCGGPRPSSLQSGQLNQFGVTGNFDPGSVQEFSGDIGNKVLFETDSSNLTPTARRILDAQALWLNQYGDYSILVEGHADERGTREYNIALGARRATATKDYLIAKGIASSRLKTISYGKERPVSVCDDISCWSQNRRAITQLNN